MLRGLYDWTMNLAGHKRAGSALFAVSFAESSFFPIPPDVMIIPMVLADRTRAWRIALICTVASVLGAILGYAIGAGLYESVGKPMMGFYGYGAKFETFTAHYNEWGAWIVAGAALTPFPFKVITIASGVASLDPFTFITSAILARGARFYAVAALLWRFGEPIRAFIERNLSLLSIAFFALLLGGFVLIKYVF
ncbi:MAG: YqaA family protein [Alphaproteobacteria bacterium]|jgi:membrane protein YqaA with SNARE-associated domain